MANIRPGKITEAPKVLKQQQVAEAPQDPMPAFKAQIDRALKDGNFSQNETRDLETALQANPQAKGAVADYLKGELEKRIADGKPVSVSEVALSKLGQAVGLDLKELFFRRQAQSSTVHHEVNQGLEKTATVVDNTTASQNRLDKQKALNDAHKGVVERPVGGSKGAAYDAAGVLAAHVEGKIDERLPAELRDAKKVLREPLIKTGTAVLNEMKKGDTLKKVGDVSAQIGKPGFKEALSNAAGSVGTDIVNATNMTAVNVDAVNAVVSGTQTAVKGLEAVTKGTKLEQIVAQHAPKLAEGVTKLGAKVAQGGAAAANTAKAATVAAEGAQVAKTATQVGVAGAEATGQAVPILGQALGVVTTGLATAELVGHCRQSPKDWKRIISAGANVIGQAVGIFIPFVGAATTVGKLALDAGMNAHDKKVGKETASPVGVKDVSGHVDNATGLLSPFLEAAGYGDAAGKLRNYNEQLKKLGDSGHSSTSFAQMPAAERDEMMQMLAAAGAEIEKAAPEAKGTPYEASATLLGEGLKQLMGLWRKSKNVESAEDPEAEKKKLAGEAMEAAGKATAAKAVADA